MARLTSEDIENCASVWFARLERARTLGDWRREAEAERNLRRLGVNVDWPAATTRPVCERKEGAP